MPDHPAVRCFGSVKPAAPLPGRFLLCLLALALPNAWAQSAAEDALAEQLTAMAKLAPFLGTWLGEGWFTVEGKRVELIQGVTVTAELAGQVITTRDIILRRTQEPAAPRSATFGIWSYDSEQDAYEFRSYFGGDYRDYAMEVPERGLLIATGETPGGLGRLTMDGRDGIWRERAERSADSGQTWSTLYEITMRRQTAPDLRGR